MRRASILEELDRSRSIIISSYHFVALTFWIKRYCNYIAYALFLESTQQQSLDRES